MLQRKKKNSSRLTGLILLRGQHLRDLRIELARHAVGEVVDVGAAVAAGEEGAVGVEEVAGEAAMAKRTRVAKRLRNRLEKSANAQLSLMVALILVSVVKLSPQLRRRKKQKQMPPPSGMVHYV